MARRDVYIRFVYPACEANMIFVQKQLNFGCNDKGQHFQDRTERAAKQDPPEAEMQRRVTSRGDIDKWSKLAKTSKH